MLVGGEPYVMIFGMEMMLELLAGSWDFLHGVNFSCIL